MKVLRTPDDRFESLPGYPFQPSYVTITEPDGTELRMHHVDAGPRDGSVVLMLHGEPTWSYLYRKMIPIVAAAGHRVIAPDLIGFGRSDKPSAREDYSYARHLAWLTAFLDAIAIRDITLFCQDWGGLLGLRLVAAQPDRFARVMASNTFLPVGGEPNEAFIRWRDFSQNVPELQVGRLIARTATGALSPEEIAAYDAPFPDESFKAGARIFPMLVPFGDDPEGAANKAAWQSLTRFEKPFLTAFGDSDPIMAGLDSVFQKRVPGARGQNHTTVAGAGHFSQEDRGEELAATLVEFMRENG